MNQPQKPPEFPVPETHHITSFQKRLRKKWNKQPNNAVSLSLAMPNTVVIRVIIRGSVDHITEIWNTFFVGDAHKPDSVRTKNWMDEDPLANQIANAGTLFKTPTTIAFSTYEGSELHTQLWRKAAAALPPGCTLTVAGFDMDDLDETTSRGSVLVIETRSGHVVKQFSPHAFLIAKRMFPQMIAQLFPTRPSFLEEPKGVTVWNKAVNETPDWVPVSHVRPEQQAVPEAGTDGPFVVSFQGRDIARLPDRDSTLAFIEDLFAKHDNICVTVGSPRGSLWGPRREGEEEPEQEYD